MKTQSALIAGGLAIVLVIAMLIWLATRSAAPSAEETDTTTETPTSQAQSESQNQNQNQTQDQDEVATASVSITNSGFEPSNITVQPGTTVTWTNNNDAAHIVASDPHPTHGETPGFESDELAPGESYSFTFDDVKTYGYHDHLNPSLTGSITVSE